MSDEQNNDDSQPKQHDFIKLPKGEYLLHEGDEGTQMYFVKDGTMAVFKKKGDEDIQIGTVYAGELVGEMSFLDKAPRCATVLAMTDCELLEIPYHKFEKTFKDLPLWYRALISTLLDRIRRANDKIRI